ncbi:N-acetylglucosamine kinase [Vibrio sp. DW001]|uniref:BadF/BadG/BcrA/BcrD ATPase family protein n=1 Tax=Vibrio sp. DW001 TaxID=2912315 RepID=UPI0023B186AC|nr:BadF/BadG/BcrA/BcrD ATPase family protein [Vibrio sp. DW001]WED27829.1 N-acetylglucosamine kinase [Vibrio sp. DW001]
MMTEFAIVIDGAATKTVAQLIRKTAAKELVDEKPVDSVRSTAASLTVDSKAAINVVTQLITDTLHKHNISAVDCDLAIGLAGASNVEAKRQLVHQLSAHPVCLIETDAYCSVLGANLGQPVNCLAIGTGSVGTILYPNLTHQIVGGWGFPAGDQGGGAWLGLQAMQNTINDIETKDFSALSQAVCDKIGHSRIDILSQLRGATASWYAQLAPIVIEHRESCPQARAIFQAGCKEIIKLYQTILHAENQNAQSLPFTCIGGLAAFYLPALLSSEHVDSYRWIKAKGDALAGAKILLQSTVLSSTGT